MSTSTLESPAAVRALDRQAAEADAKTRALDYAAQSTEPAKAAMRSIRCISPREVWELLACVQMLVERSTWAFSDDGCAVQDGLDDAVGAAERAAEREEECHD